MLPKLLPNDETKISCEAASNRESPKASKTTNSLKEPTEYFLGFEDTSSKLEELWYRWKALENWIELALRPRNCHPEDRWLLKSNGSVNNEDDSSNEYDDEEGCIDDLEALKNQCSLVQNLFNEHLSTLPVETTRWESSLVVRPSQIPGAGMGLYYQPLQESQEEENQRGHQQEQQEQQEQQQQTWDEPTTSAILPSGSLICYYTGQVHTHSSASALSDQSYLLWIRDNTLVDPRPLAHIQARYANDPLNEALVNCAFVPTAISSRAPNEDRKDSPPKPHPDTIRTSVVTTRDILPGEELFVSYGDIYWNQQPIVGNRLVLHGSNGSSSGSDNKSQEIVRDDPEQDSDDGEDSEDETFPFSPLFQNKLLAKPILWENASTTE